MTENVDEREQRLLERERALAERERKSGDPDRDFGSGTRLLMTVFAQGGGFFLLSILGVLISWPSDQPDIVRGYNFIQKISLIYLLITIVLPVVVLVIAAVQREIKQGHVDIILLGYVGSDLLLLLLLVKQQGGLCRSMFLPVFFLIPIAYMIVERRASKYRVRRLAVLLAIVGCICSAYRISLQHPPPSNPDLHVQGSVRVLWREKRITDFDALAHPQYDEAVFYASLVSAFVPILQILVLIAHDRLKKTDANGNRSAAPPIF